MSEARLIGPVTIRPEIQALVDFYTGINFEVAEIETLAETLANHARELRSVHTQKLPINIKCNADVIASRAKQMAILAEHLSKVTKIHVNRKPRIAS